MKFLFISIFASMSFCLCNAQTVYLYTPRQGQVYAFTSQEMSESEINRITLDYAINYPQATILAYPSATYNCHSYAWNMVEGGFTCWLNQFPDLKKYWEDGSYVQTTESEAEKIFYFNGDHSAVVSSVAGKYESKWGSAPLMRHSPGYGPSSYGMAFRRYYKRSNPQISGPSIVCTSGNTFTLNDEPQSNIQWNATEPFQITNVSNDGTTVTVTKIGLGNGEGTLSASVGGFVVATKTITPCKTTVSLSLGGYMCSYTNCTIENLPSNISGSQIAWSCSSNLQLQEGNTGLTNTVRPIALASGSAWVEAQIGNHTFRTYTYILGTSDNTANIFGQANLNLGSSANYLLKAFTDPIIDPNSPLCDCYYYYWTCSPNLEISYEGPTSEPEFSKSGGEEPEYPDEPEEEYELTASVRAIGCGAGWIKAHVVINGHTLTVTKNINVVNCSKGANSKNLVESFNYVSSYPNPVSNILNVKIDMDIYAAYKLQKQVSSNAVKQSKPVFQILLYSSLGNLVLRTTTTTDQAQLSVSQLPPGNYVLHVSDGSGDKPSTQQVLVRR